MPYHGHSTHYSGPWPHGDARLLEQPSVFARGPCCGSSVSFDSADMPPHFRQLPSNDFFEGAGFVANPTAPMQYLSTPHYPTSLSGSTETAPRTDASGDEQDHDQDHDDDSSPAPSTSNTGTRQAAVAPANEHLSSTKADRKRAHTAVERKYRGNLIQNFDSLRKALNTAQSTHTRAMVLNSLAKRQGTSSPIPRASEVGNKKSEILSSAISFVQQSEQINAHLLQEIALLRSQLDELDQSRRNDNLAALEQMANITAAVSIPAASRAGLMETPMATQHGSCSMTRAQWQAPQWNAYS